MTNVGKLLTWRAAHDSQPMRAFHLWWRIINDGGQLFKGSVIQETFFFSFPQRSYAPIKSGNWRLLRVGTNGRAFLLLGTTKTVCFFLYLLSKSRSPLHLVLDFLSNASRVAQVLLMRLLSMHRSTCILRFEVLFISNFYAVSTPVRTRLEYTRVSTQPSKTLNDLFYIKLEQFF